MSTHPYPPAGMHYAPPVPAGDPTAVMGRRVGAWIVDSVIVAAPAVALFTSDLEYIEESDLPAGQSATDFCDAFNDQDETSVCVQANDRVYFTDDLPVGPWLLGLGVSLLLLVVLQGLKGWTPGKLLFGIRTVREDGRSPGIGKALVRWLLLIVDLLCAGLVGFIVALTNKGHRRVGDMAAKTYVVRRESAGQPVVLPGEAPPYPGAYGGYPGYGGYPSYPGGPGYGYPGAPGQPGGPPPGWGPPPGGPPPGQPPGQPGQPGQPPAWGAPPAGPGAGYPPPAWGPPPPAWGPPPAAPPPAPRPDLGETGPVAEPVPPADADRGAGDQPVVSEAATGPLPASEPEAIEQPDGTPARDAPDEPASAEAPPAAAVDAQPAAPGEGVHEPGPTDEGEPGPADADDGQPGDEQAAAATESAATESAATESAATESAPDAPAGEVQPEAPTGEVQATGSGGEAQPGDAGAATTADAAPASEAAPAEAPSATPVEAPIEAPADATAEEPAEAQAQTPAEPLPADANVAPTAATPSYNPQWDPARGTYIVWSPERGQWLGWDDTAKEWRPL